MTDFAQALVAELARKSGLLWVAYSDQTHPVWHEWIGDAVCVVVGGTEQPLPDIASQSTVTLLLRSKATRFLIAAAEAKVQVVAPSDDAWDSVTTALRNGRLNLRDRDTATERWARESTVLRFVPTGTITQASELDATIGQSVPKLAHR